MNKIAEDKWKQIGDDTVKRMIEHVSPFLSPISKAISQNEGEHLGTGTYFELEGMKYIITNEHVAKYIVNHSLTHKFFESDNILRIISSALSIPSPVDVAVFEIPDSSWGFVKHSAQAISSDRFAARHNTAIHEWLFFAGFSYERSKFYFNNLFTPGTPYLTQECPLPTNVPEANSDIHFSLFYKPDLARSIDGTSYLPNPHGFSGSLVWDTKRVACLSENLEWKPEMAQVTGIVWGWPSSAACILATKVEHLELTKLVSEMVKMSNNANDI